MTIPVGDRVKFCRNEYRQLQVSNGTLGAISSITQLDGDVRLSVMLDNERTISFLALDYRCQFMPRVRISCFQFTRYYC